MSTRSSRTSPPLNAQVPKYDLVVAANNAYTAGVARRASVLNAAVDWPLALSNLISITPANAKVLSLQWVGQRSSERPPASTASSTHYRLGVDRRHASALEHTTSAAIGTIQFGVTGPGPSLSISEAWINAVAGSELFANPLQGRNRRESRHDHLVSRSRSRSPQCQPQQECEPEMNTVREYRMPLMIGAGALVVALLLWAVLVSPQTSKLSSLQSQGDPTPGTADRTAGQTGLA